MVGANELTSLTSHEMQTPYEAYLFIISTDFFRYAPAFAPVQSAKAVPRFLLCKSVMWQIVSPHRLRQALSAFLAETTPKANPATANVPPRAWLASK